MEVYSFKLLLYVPQNPVSVSGTGYLSDATHGHEPTLETAKCWIQCVCDHNDNHSPSVSFDGLPGFTQLVRIVGFSEAHCS